MCLEMILYQSLQFAALQMLWTLLAGVAVHNIWKTLLYLFAYLPYQCFLYHLDCSLIQAAKAGNFLMERPLDFVP